MSRYLLPENKKVLWDYMQKIPQFQKSDHTSKDALFRNTVYKIYHENEHRDLSLADLQALNRDTIAQIVSQLRQPVSAVPLSTPVSGTLSNHFISGSAPVSLEPASYVSREYFSEQKQDEINRQFNERQKEYAGMLSKNAPTNIDFREAKDIDKPIENMEELIRIQMMNRKLDIDIPPKPLVQGFSNTVSNPVSNPISNPVALHIHETTQLDAPIINVSPNNSDKKHVSWDLSQNQTMYYYSNDVQELRKEIADMKSQILELTEKLSKLEKANEAATIKTRQDHHRSIQRVIRDHPPSESFYD